MINVFNFKSVKQAKKNVVELLVKDIIQDRADIFVTSGKTVSHIICKLGICFN